MKGLNLKAIGSSIRNFGSGFKFQVVKNAPTILVIGGGVGTVVAMGVAISKTRQLDGIVSEHEEKIRRIKQLEAANNTKLAKETTMAYVETAGNIARLYALPLTIEGASLFAIFTAHKMMNKRVATLGAAYATLDAGYREYKARVAEKYGAEEEKKLRLGTKTVTVDEETTDEDGNRVIESKTVEYVRPDQSEYRKLFTKANPYWDNSPDVIKHFFLQVERELNDKIRARARGPKGIGCVTLNEAYKLLGFEPTTPGMVIGWLRNRKDPMAKGIIELEVTEIQVMNENGVMERAYAVDFNVTGNVYQELHQLDLALQGQAS